MAAIEPSEARRRMARKRPKATKIEKKSDVDIDLAAIAFMAGVRSERLKLSGDALMEIFMGAVIETRPKSDNFEDQRYMGKAIRDAMKGDNG
jgi:hypothetical protein